MSKKKIITIVVIIALIIFVIAIRSINASKKQNLAEPTNTSIDDVADSVQDDNHTEEEVTPVPEKPYESSLNVNASKDDKDSTPTVIPEVTATPEPEPSKVTVYCSVTGSTGVPKKNMDGSSCKDFFNSISLSDFEVNWGSSLTNEDISSSEYTLVGTEQIKSGDLRSLGWLSSNISDLDKHSAVYFTNLHVIGNLSEDGVALLCSYDWYSAYGLKDTLVLLEDISGTLKADDFSDGDVVSTVVFVKNIMKQKVGGQTIICIQYATE